MTTAPTTEKELLDIITDGALADEMRKAIADMAKAAVKEAEEQIKKDAANSARRKRLPWSGKGHAHSAAAPGAAADGEWDSFGEYLTQVYRAPTKGLDPRLTKAALAEGAGETGGFVVPEEFRANLLALAIEGAFFRPRATTIPMSSSTMRIPTIKDTSHASSVLGGIVATWENEAATIDESEPTFSQIQLIAKKLTGYTVASNELLADNAVSLEALLVSLFGRAIVFYEEEAFINGTGVGSPLGLVSAPCTISVSKETGQAAATIVYENLNKMYKRLLPSSRNNAVWIANIDTFDQFASMSLSVGTGGTAVFIPPAGAQNAPPMTLWGRPIIFTEHCQTLGTVGDIILVDPTYYLIGDRQALQVAASPHVKFTTDETVWRFTERLDGRPWLESPLTPIHGSNTLSPIVTLATRS